jgi:hypothetical protein
MSDISETENKFKKNTEISESGKISFLRRGSSCLCLLNTLHDISPLFPRRDECGMLEKLTSIMYVLSEEREKEHK